MTFSCVFKVSLVVFLCSESPSDAADATPQNGGPVQIKEEEEETEKPPAAKRKRGQSKKAATKTEEMPKEEIKSEGIADLIVILYC